MFVQIIRGRTGDEAGLRRLAERWRTELAPGAGGWLGSTMGVTADGDFIAVARFAGADDARRNSERSEQGAWWAEFSKHLDGEATFADCEEADTFLAGGSDDAGFVQVITSEVTDQDRARRSMAAMADLQPEDFGRPDLLGGLFAWHREGNGLTQVAYFTSEEEARKGEAQPPPQRAQEAMRDWDEAVGGVEYYDLTDPWLFSP